MKIDAKVLKAMGGLTSKEQSRGALGYVLVEKDGDYTNIVACDAYVLAWLRVDNSELDEIPEGDYQYLLPANAIKNVTAGKTVSVYVGADFLSGYGKTLDDICTVSFSQVSYRYMNWKQLITKPTGEATDVVGLNPDYVANGCKLVRTVFGKNANMQLEVGEDSCKPVRIVCGDAKKQLVYVTMPVRFSNGNYSDKYKLYF